MIVTIYRTFVLLKPLICPVGTDFIFAQLGCLIRAQKTNQ